MSEDTTIPKLKTNPKYADAPRFPLIYKYEGEMKDNYDKIVKVMTTELAKTMIEYAKQP